MDSTIPDQYDDGLESVSYEKDFEMLDNDDDKSSTEDDHGLSDDDVLVEQFTASDFYDLNFESDHEYPDANINSNDS